jgi:hypothetical protein
MRFFAKFWEGGYIGVVKIFWGGYNFLGFYTFIAFLLTSFAKVLEGWSACTYDFSRSNKLSFKKNYHELLKLKSSKLFKITASLFLIVFFNFARN